MQRPGEVTFAPLKRASHSTLEGLRSCQLRVAFGLDEGFAAAQQQSTWALLGTAVHGVYEALARGEFDGLDEDAVETAVGSQWEALIAARVEELKSEPDGLQPPPPERWPRYQLTRVRLVNAVSEVARRRVAPREAGGQPARGSVAVEEWTETKDGLLVGRVDRVESGNGRLELVDIKNGVSWPEPSLGPDSSYGRQLLLYAFIWHDQHGEWPDVVSLQRTDGTRVSAQLDKALVEEQGREAYRLLEEFNEAVSRSPSEGSLASPSAETCDHCPFRGACNPFLKATGPEWDMFRETVRGTVVKAEDTTKGPRLTLAVSEGTVPTGRQWRLAPVPGGQELQPGETVSASDVMSTRASTDLRAEWDSVWWQW